MAGQLSKLLARKEFAKFWYNGIFYWFSFEIRTIEETFCIVYLCVVILGVQQTFFTNNRAICDNVKYKYIKQLDYRI